MAPVATTKLSSKGQVVIPEEVRNQLGLKAGDQFVVVGEGDTVILKTITPPSIRDFDAIIEKARKQAKATRMKRLDIAKAIDHVRGRG